MPATSASRLFRQFDPDIRAVGGIELEITEGTIFGFLDQNGSGKTTTVRMLTTLLRPTAGDAHVVGLDVRREADGETDTRVRHAKERTQISITPLATIKPVTYILEGMRSLVIEGWNWSALAAAVASILGLGALTMTLVLLALRSRTA